MTQLLRRKLVKLCHLSGEFLCVLEALREKNDLCNKRVVRNHHGYGPEQHLEVVRKLSPPLISRVHCDKDAHIFVKFLNPFLSQCDVGIVLC